ncbi:MAG TPA: hypothetical protein DCL77_14200 [Prolixibacteraceae bacterium]|jgi:ferric-dicitrate binding protein FerR (iron transport regulator)|nr:hypothetical protein [Prolixibacteraceae bacterium]
MATENDLILRYLLKELSPEEENNFRRWAESDPENSRKVEQYKDILEKTKNYPKGFNPDVYNALAKVHAIAGIGKTINLTSRFSTILKIAVAASLIIGFIGLTYYAHFTTSSQAIVMHSGMNGTREIVLSDSSHVWLNENSTLQVPSVFTKKQRKVILKGEAYFEIKRDEHKPFIICTGNTTTKVLGTSFNIKMDTLAGNVNVVVLTGKVEFYGTKSESEKAILTPTQQGMFSGSTGKILCSLNSNINYLAWKTGVLTFDNTPLIEVCNELSKHFKKSVKATPNVSEESLTGTFNNEKLEDILNTIQLTLDVKIRISADEIIICN